MFLDPLHQNNCAGLSNNSLVSRALNTHTTHSFSRENIQIPFTLKNATVFTVEKKVRKTSLRSVCIFWLVCLRGIILIGNSLPFEASNCHFRITFKWPCMSFIVESCFSFGQLKGKCVLTSSTVHFVGKLTDS
jgi:hypothetical protein